MKKIIFSIVFTFTLASAFAQWTLCSPTPTNEDLLSVHFPTHNIGFVVGRNGTILKTNDSGATWTTQTSGTPADLTSVYFPNADIGYAVGFSGTILKTVNGGTTWNSLSSGTTKGLSSVYFSDSQTGYAVGDSGTLLKTINGGATWNPNQGYSTNFTSVFFIDANTGYSAGSSGTIIKTVDGGQTWFSQVSGSDKELRSIHFTDINNGYAVVISDLFILNEETNFIKTTDGGSSWNPIKNITPHDISSLCFTDANIGYTVGAIHYRQNGFILKTINGGSTWDTLSIGNTSWLSSIFFTDSNTGYAVGGIGTILKTTTGGTLSVNEVKSIQPLFTITPNPAVNKISITSPTNLCNETTILIFNLQGDKLFNNTFHNQDRIELAVSILKPGIYLVKLQTKYGVEIQKLIIQ